MGERVGKVATKARPKPNLPGRRWVSAVGTCDTSGTRERAGLSAELTSDRSRAASEIGTGRTAGVPLVPPLLCSSLSLASSS